MPPLPFFWSLSSVSVCVCAMETKEWSPAVGPNPGQLFFSVLFCRLCACSVRTCTVEATQLSRVFQWTLLCTKDACVGYSSWTVIPVAERDRRQMCVCWDSTLIDWTNKNHHIASTVFDPWCELGLGLGPVHRFYTFSSIKDYRYLLFYSYLLCLYNEFGARFAVQFAPTAKIVIIINKQLVEENG